MVRDWIVGCGTILEPPDEPHPVTPATAATSRPKTSITNVKAERRRLRKPRPASRTPGKTNAANELACAADDGVAVTVVIADPVTGSIDSEPTVQETEAGALQEMENAPRKLPTGAALIEKLAA
jgi:hypothetical protein